MCACVPVCLCVQTHTRVQRPHISTALWHALQVLVTPETKPPPARPPKLSECSPLFMAVGGLREPVQAPLPRGHPQPQRERTAGHAAVEQPWLRQPQTPCAVLLVKQAYEMRNAGAVIHSHSVNALLATLLEPDSDEFMVTHIEMIKGIEGHGFYGGRGLVLGPVRCFIIEPRLIN